VAATHQPLRHIRAHPAETNHCNFHALQPSSRERIAVKYISDYGRLSIVITAGLPTASNRPVKVRPPVSGFK
jgi:hypothetical protein